MQESNWNLEMLVFVEGEKPEKNPRSRDENQQHSCTGHIGGRCELSPVRHPSHPNVRVMFLKITSK